MITRTFKLCLNAGTGSAPYINVNQYDEGETWLFELYTEQGERYLPTTGAIVGIKSDGHGIANTGTVDSNGRVVITETEQMTAAAGRAIFELSIDGLTHGTANFIVMVERKPTDDAIMSDSDYSMFQEVIDAAEVIEDVIGDGDPSEVIGEHVDAWLDNHPEATTTVEDGAITAPKINNSLWDKILVNEEASGAVASFDDGADDVPVSSLKVALEPVQLGSGNPSPSNVRPIYPANGKNLFDKDNANILNAYINGSNVITSSSVDCMVYIPILANQQFSVTYTQKALATASQSDDMQIGLFDSIPVAGLTGVKIYNATRSTPTVDMKVSYTGNSSSHTWLAMKIGNTDRTDITASMATLQIEYGNATAYQPYQGIMVEKIGKNIYTATLYKDNRGLNGSGAEYSSSSYRIDRENLFPNTQYTISLTYTGESVSQAVRFQFYDASGEMVGNLTSVTLRVGEPTTLTFTTPLQTAYAHISINKQTENIQLEYGTTASEYEPYQSTSYPYTLGQSVYGGSVDLATGVLTVTRTSRTINGSESWARENGSATHHKYYINANDIGKPIGNNYKAEGTIICDKLITAVNSFDYTTDSIAVTAWTNHSVDSNYLYLIVNNAAMGFDTADGLKAWLASNPLQVVYLLATPTTIQLTPTQVNTLLGYNNISSTGTVNVIYHADTKLYVDKMTNVDNAIIAPTEADFVATKNYTVNDLVIVNDTLYKCTANIASGSAITPNSNVQQTTLGALIKALCQ